MNCVLNDPDIRSPDLTTKDDDANHSSDEERSREQNNNNPKIMLKLKSLPGDNLSTINSKRKPIQEKTVNNEM